jgi:hypothetical protein
MTCKIFYVSTGKKYCSTCNPNGKTRQKTREMIVINYLHSLQEPYSEFTHNQSAGFICGNFKPDVLYDCGTHFLVIEVDENQHKQYEEDCENSRMQNIYQSLGLPVIFLRYNPDSYQGLNSKKSTLEFRLEKLVQEIGLNMKRIPTSPVTAIYMFYDQDCKHRGKKQEGIDTIFKSYDSTVTSRIKSEPETDEDEILPIIPKSKSILKRYIEEEDDEIVPIIFKKRNMFVDMMMFGVRIK